MRHIQTPTLFGVMLASVFTLAAHAQQSAPGAEAAPGPQHMQATQSPRATSADAQGAAETFAFSRLDTNRNFRISRSEAAASEPLAQHFEQVDQNHDLQITPSEFSAFEVEQMRAQQKTQRPTADGAEAMESNAAPGTETVPAAAEDAPPATR